jgi:hypothetical protein
MQFFKWVFHAVRWGGSGGISPDGGILAGGGRSAAGFFLRGIVRVYGIGIYALSLLMVSICVSISSKLIYSWELGWFG